MPEWSVVVLIFSARLLDVPIGTIRMMMVMAGHSVLAACLGFFEVIIWVIAVGKAISHLDSVLALVAYGAGFAFGTLLGMAIEQRLAIGWRVIRVINPKPEVSLAGALNAAGLPATRLDGHGGSGPVELVFLAVKRRVVPGIMDQIAAIAPDAVVSIERAEKVSGFTQLASVRGAEKPWRFGMLRK